MKSCILRISGLAAALTLGVSGGYSSEFRVAISDGCLVYGDRYTQIEVDTVSGNLDLLINR